ncbi:alpha/beta hydrolase [Mycolicibacterium mucogenicum]|uniref:Alpha/beta hydrolase n=1 Tax=Mycolicibacterium mucogenicum DSM 44124 TaxID=1226753 RepID=A0A8H2PH74_MYCMU|nr:alpha/beta hydrolase [Mycolicibacterium mucogenicum]KAB7751115.1 lipase [Mycolicibacterium mucogenicum DSM 44124]QPG72071.1 alpha/beta hydrolase [Mycolicibacterium mucogenicum DSM 44124]
MTESPALHPQARAHLAAAATAPGIATLSVPDARLAILGYLDLQRPAPVMAQVQHRFIPGPTADLPVRIYRPTRDPGPHPVIVVLHGSGWVIGNLDLVDEPARVLARDTGYVVLAVNYQKAPERRFPVPLQDCVATVRWVHTHASELGVDPSRLAVVGDSAGGNLAAATTAELAGTDVMVAAQALLYPALDRRMATPSYAAFARGFGLDAADMAWFWNHYVDVDASEDPRVSPLRANSFAHLPSTFVATAGHDVLRDEAETYAGLLSDAGVDVVVRRYPGMIHGFWWMDGVLDDSRTLQRDLAEFLVDRLSR